MQMTIRNTHKLSNRLHRTGENTRRYSHKMANFVRQMVTPYSIDDTLNHCSRNICQNNTLLVSPNGSAPVPPISIWSLNLAL